MVVSSTPAPAAHGVIRTCVGCRKRGSATELLRVIVSREYTGGDDVPVHPDPRRRAAGRGAWLHPDLRCMELAERRRAFGRALRVSGRVDPTAVRAYLESVTRSATTGADIGRHEPRGNPRR